MKDKSPCNKCNSTGKINCPACNNKNRAPKALSKPYKFSKNYISNCASCNGKKTRVCGICNGKGHL